MKIPYLWLMIACTFGCSSSPDVVSQVTETETEDTFAVTQPDVTPEVSSIPDTGPECTSPTPFYAEWLDQCCECLVGTHCTSGACNDDCSCAAPGKSCALCSGATPVCRIENGEFVECVGCLTSEDCDDPAATCIENSCSSPPPTPPEIDGIPVTCQAGECWGTNGKCNGDTVLCKGGAQCITLDLLFEGSVPEGVVDPGGHCKCKPTPGELPGTEQGDCPDELICGRGPLWLLVSLIDGSINVPTHCYVEK